MEKLFVDGSIIIKLKTFCNMIPCVLNPLAHIHITSSIVGYVIELVYNLRTVHNLK
jgi:hypothetical protein